MVKEMGKWGSFFTVLAFTSPPSSSSLVFGFKMGFATMKRLAQGKGSSAG